jgi:predicted TPR repeat methyltransferase
MQMSVSDEAARAWDREYVAGRYHGESPVPLIHDILAWARKRGVRKGLYIGCGNGRNFIPLIDAGLDLVGLDISAVALQQLSDRAPAVAHRLVRGDLSALSPDEQFELVIGIQVFQHGMRDTCHAHIRAAQSLVDGAGLLAIRVNAVDTDIEYEHDVIERNADGGYTVRYRDGPKSGLAIHFFARSELESLFSESFQAVLPLRVSSTVRQPPGRGQWSQWEGIWERIQQSP